jgi:hypothetical protein
MLLTRLVTICFIAIANGRVSPMDHDESMNVDTTCVSVPPIGYLGVMQ